MYPGAQLQAEPAISKYHESFQPGERHSGVDLSLARKLIFRDIGPIKEIRI
jgi:hypothetical protein